jgi:DNA-binding beta-propeller fold protein YncE
LGNNSVEVIDLKKNKLIHSIRGLHEPQGIVFIPGSNALFVANGGDGSCAVFNATSFNKITSVALPGDADNVRYDSVNNKLYVGYGNGGIVILDAGTFKLLGDIKLQGHPESFQLDIPAKKIYVNVPDKQQVEKVDTDKQVVIERWKLTAAQSNFPMALDAVHHRLLIGCRRPAKLLVLDSNTGKLVTAVDTDNDVDDLFYDHENGYIYLSCGGGQVDIIRQKDPDTYTLMEKLPSRGGARTSLLVPQLKILVVAAPKNFRSDAALFLYGIKN